MDEFTAEEKRIIRMALRNWDGYDSQTKDTYLDEMVEARSLADRI